MLRFGRYVLGGEVEAFERKFASYVGAFGRKINSICEK